MGKKGENSGTLCMWPAREEGGGAAPHRQPSRAVILWRRAEGGGCLKNYLKKLPQIMFACTYDDAVIINLRP